MPPRQRCPLPRRHRHTLSSTLPASLPSIKQAKAIMRAGRQCCQDIVVRAFTQASESRRPRAPLPASLLPSRKRVKPTSARASASIVAAVTRASESRRPRPPPPASSSKSRKREPMSARASASVIVTVTQASGANVCARLRQRRHRCHASKSPSPRAPPPSLSSPSREREPTSLRASASVVVAVTRASGADVGACLCQRRCCRHASES